jgi:hypothetical protein
MFVIHNAPNRVLLLASSDTQVALEGPALEWAIALSGSSRACSRNFPQFARVVAKVLVDCLLNSATHSNRAHSATCSATKIYTTGEPCGLEETASWSENGWGPFAALGHELECFGKAGQDTALT